MPLQRRPEERRCHIDEFMEAISFALAAAYQFGLVGWLSVYGLYLYIEGLRHDH